MKKIMAVMLSLLACTVLLAGCNTSSESNEEQSLKVYSFSGENEYISVSNGVIILDGKDEICYGGDLKVMSDDFANTQTQNIPSKFIPARPTMPLERTTAPSTGLIMTPFTVMCCGKSGNVPELP